MSIWILIKLWQVLDHGILSLKSIYSRNFITKSLFLLKISSSKAFYEHALLTCIHPTSMFFTFPDTCAVAREANNFGFEQKNWVSVIFQPWTETRWKNKLKTWNTKPQWSVGLSLKVLQRKYLIKLIKYHKYKIFHAEKSVVFSNYHQVKK